MFQFNANSRVNHLLIGCVVLFLSGCSDYSDCVIHGLTNAHSDQAVLAIKEVCRKKFESQISGSDARSITGRANISNPYKDNTPAKERSEDEEYKKFLRGHVKVSVNIKNDTFNWLVTGLAIRIVLDKEKNLSEIHKLGKMY